MRTIERYYLNQAVSYWIILSSLVVGMQALLIASKEYQKLSGTYTVGLWAQYIGIDSLGLFLDIAPITIFLSVVLINWQWSKKSLWLSAALSGQDSGNWVKVISLYVAGLLVVLMSLRYFFWSSLSHDIGVKRLEALGKMPALEQSRQIASYGAYLAYRNSIGEQSLFDTHSQSPLSLESFAGFKALEAFQHQMKVDLKVGLASVPLSQKVLYKKQAGLEDKRFLNGAIIKEVLYPVLILCAVILGWRDSPMQWSQRHTTLSPVRITLSLTALYTALKISPLATLFFKPSQVIWSLMLILSLALLLPRSKETWGAA